jgi:hypothetical protein
MSRAATDYIKDYDQGTLKNCHHIDPKLPYIKESILSMICCQCQPGLLCFSCRTSKHSVLDVSVDFGKLI